VTVFLASREEWGFRNNNSYWDDVRLEVQANELVLTAQCQAWSNHHDRDAVPGHEACVGKPHCSWGVGEANYFRLLDNAPPLNGVPWNDAIINVAFRLGLDLTGGTDPLATTVQWGAWHLSYNYHNGLRFAVQLDADVPEHVDYEVLVRTPAQSPASHQRVCEIARQGLDSVVASYDDTGRLCNVICPSGKGGRAILYDIPVADRQRFLDWYAEHYPLARVEFAEPSTQWDDYLLSQGDPRWADYIYAGGECYSLAHQGCYITCCAMAQRIYGIDPDATPVTVDQELGAEGYDNCLMLWSHMPQLGIEVADSTTDAAEAAAHLAQGDLVFTEVEPSTLMHFVLAVEHDGVDFLVLDPWKNKVDRLRNLYTGAESFRLIQKVQEIPPIEPPTVVGPTISFHMQGPEAGLTEYVRTVQPESFKLCHIAGEARMVHEASPDTLIVYRKVYNNWHDFIYGYGNLQEAARSFVEWLRPELEELTDALGDTVFAVEGLNETIATGALEDIDRVAEFEAYFAQMLVAEYPTARPVVLNTAVGNPQHGAETEMLIPAVQAAVDARGYVGYHAYWPSIGDRTWLESDWRHYAGRWATSWDETFRAHGLRPRYLLTEGGPIGGEVHGDVPHLNAGAGWRSANCLNGDWARARAEILRFDELARDSVPGREGRYLGIHLFTVAGGHEWRHFAYRQSQFEELAA
jgi:hypothetical protein